VVPAGSRFGPCAKNTVARGSVDRGGGFVNELVSLVVWFCKGREREREPSFLARLFYEPNPLQPVCG